MQAGHPFCTGRAGRFAQLGTLRPIAPAARTGRWIRPTRLQVLSRMPSSHLRGSAVAPILELQLGRLRGDVPWSRGQDTGL